MQEKHSDVHIIAIAALVFVAASAIMQTAIGLNEDKLSAIQSQHMFATVAASTATSPNPNLRPIANQLRMVQVDPAGNAIIIGTVIAATSNSIIVRSWGGDWRVLVSSAARLDGAAGRQSLAAFRPGHVVYVAGIVNQSTPNVVAAKIVHDYTALNVPLAQVQMQPFDSSMIPALTPGAAAGAINAATMPQVSPSISVTPLGVSATNSPKLVPMRSDGNFDSRTLTGQDAIGGQTDPRALKARYNLSMDPVN